jgi:hypothetical protein
MKHPIESPQDVRTAILAALPDFGLAALFLATWIAPDIVGAHRIGSLLLERQPTDAAAGITHLPPAEGWQRALAGATPETRRILLAHGDDAAIRQLIPTLSPPPDLVVGVDSAYAEPTAAPSRVGNVPLVFTGSRGRVLLDCWLHRGPDGGQVAFELVPLPASRTVPGGGGDPHVGFLVAQQLEQRLQHFERRVVGGGGDRLDPQLGRHRQAGFEQCQLGFDTRVAAEHAQREAGIDQVRSHRRAHRAEADEGDGVGHWSLRSG